MGTITGRAITDRALKLLNDTYGTPGVKFPDADSLMWLNDGQRETVVYLPTAYVRTQVRTMQAGTRQSLAGVGITDGLQFSRVTRNFETDGTTPGRAVTTRPRAWLDDNFPGWHFDASGPAVHAVFDADDPKTFWLWPPSSGTAKAEIVYFAVPADLTNLSQAIVLDDIYANALMYFMLAMHFSVNSSANRSDAAAQKWYAAYLRALGIKDQRSRAVDANKQLAGNGSGVASSGSE